MTALGYWLGRKYDALDTHAEAALASAHAQNTSASSRAGLEGITGSLLPGQTAAENALKYAQAGQSQAQTGALTNAQAPFSDDQLKALHQGVIDQRSMFGQSGSAPHAAPRQAPASGGSFWSVFGPGVGVPDASAATALPSTDTSTSTALPTPGYAAGTPKVPGKGDGTVDKVPAMLAPGEAVLNAGAAEHFGRHNIAALNAVGQAKMQAGKGAPPPTKAAPAKPQHFKGGTHMVGHGKSAQTPKIDPGVIQALMSMGGGGGGSAPPMGGAPMMPPAPGMIPPGR